MLDEAVECNYCGEVELRPQPDNPPMWECDHCHREEQ